ncbi:hypothetical protein JCM8547_006493 [Rhodosporidiobolus lusitaniae]
MAHRILSLVSLLLLSCSVHATAILTAPLRGSLALNGSLPLDLQANVVLSSLSPSSPYERVKEVYGPEGEYRFEFPRVPVGEFILRVESRRYAFAEYAIKVSPSSSSLPKKTVDDNDENEHQPTATSSGESEQQLKIEASYYSPQMRSAIPGVSLPLPLILRSTAFYTSLPPSPPAFSLLAFLKGNPMVWVMGLGVLLAVGMPKLLASLDPEVVEEVGRNQARMHGQLGNLQSFDASSAMSRFLAGSSPSSSTDSPLAAAGGGASAGGAGGGGGKGGKARKRR